MFEKQTTTELYSRADDLRFRAYCAEGDAKAAYSEAAERVDQEIDTRIEHYAEQCDDVFAALDVRPDPYELMECVS